MAWFRCSIVKDKTIIPELVASDRQHSNATTQLVHTVAKKGIYLAINLNINGEASTYTLTSPISTDGTILVNDVQTKSFSNPNRNCCTNFAIISCEVGDTITLANTQSGGNFINQFRGVWKLNNAEAFTSLTNTDFVLRSDNNVGTSTTVNLASSNDVHIALAIDTNGTGGSVNYSGVTISAQDAKYCNQSLAFNSDGLAAVSIALIKGASQVQFNIQANSNYETRGYIIYKAQ